MKTIRPCSPRLNKQFNELVFFMSFDSQVLVRSKLYTRKLKNNKQISDFSPPTKP